MTNMNPEPDQSLGFLVSDIARMLRERFNVTAQAVGLTLAQARAVAHLSACEGISQTALAQRLEIQPITLLRQIDRLEESGLVERRLNPTDRRAQQLYLTLAGEALLVQIQELAGSLTEVAFAGMIETKRDQTLALLRQIKNNLSNADPAESTMPIVEG